MTSPYTVRPFDEPEMAAARQDHTLYYRMRRFNEILSGERAMVERAFGLWKNRFLSLKEMGGHNEMQEIYRVIEALIVLHNMCIAHGDHPEHIPSLPSEQRTDRASDIEPPDLDGDDPIYHIGGPEVDVHRPIPAHETDEYLKRRGRQFRNAIFNRLVPAHD